MDANTIKRGAAAGMAGGAMMAMFAMLAMWLDGVTETGFWTPINLIAHTFWRGAPLDNEFSFGALVLGMILHMMMAMTLGAAVATIVSRVGPLGKNLGSRVLTGVGFALMVWVVMEFIAWPLVDRAAAEAFTTWIFAVSHVIFGMVTAAVLYASIARRQSAVSRFGAQTAT
jgi:hypothetical protein